MLETKDQGHNAQVYRKFSLNFSRRKKGHDFGPFLTNQKIVLSSAEYRTISRTWRLQGQGLQNVSLRAPTSAGNVLCHTTTPNGKNPLDHKMG